MTKQEILEEFSGINYAYNNASMYETLSLMLDELLKEQEDVPVDTKKQVLADRQCEISPHHYERKGFCPKCHQEIKLCWNRNYCGFCGQAVKWE